MKFFRLGALCLAPLVFMKMTWFVNKLPEGQLSSWLWYTSFAALFIPAVLGFTAMRINDRIGDIAVAKVEAEKQALEKRLSQTDETLQKANDEIVTSKKLALDAQQKAAFRSIAEENQAKFVEYVRDSKKGLVEVIAHNATPEMNTYAKLLMKMLDRAGYQVTWAPAITFGSSPDSTKGLYLIANRNLFPAYLEDLFRGFRFIDIEIPVIDDPNAPPDLVRLRICAKDGD